MPLRPVQSPVSCQVHGLKNVEVLRGTSLAVMSSETQHLSRAHHFIQELRLNDTVDSGCISEITLMGENGGKWAGLR